MKNVSPNAPGIAGFLNQYGFAAIVLLLGLFGTFLRLYSISDHILMNDEWHGLLYATQYPVSYLLGHPAFAANCAPLNAYFRLLLDTIGWSENWIRLPSLLPGILSLFLFPYIVRKAHGQTRIQGIGWCAQQLQRNYGPPVYIDESLIVFDVSQSGNTGAK